MKMEDIDFGSVMKKKEKWTTFKFKNTTRRNLAWKLSVDKIMEDVFEVEIESGIAKPKEEVTIRARFKPKSNTSYTVDAKIVTEEGVLPFSIVGQGTQARISASNESIDFGVVGINAHQYVYFNFENPTSSQLNLELKTTSDLFEIQEPYIFSNSRIVKIEPHERHSAKILFKPTIPNISTNAKFQVLNTEIPGEPETIFDTEITATSGIQSYKKLISHDESITMTNDQINIVFKDLRKGDRTRKFIELENTGDTVLMFDILLNDKKHESETTTSKIGVKIEGGNTLNPHTKLRVNINVRAINEGSETFTVKIVMRSLVIEEIVKIECQSIIVSGLSSLQESIKAFSRVDDSIEDSLNFKLMERKKYNTTTEIELWKILLPVVRVSNLLPSEELMYVAPVKPFIGNVSLGVERPVALPKVAPVKAKKYFMQSASETIYEKRRADGLVNAMAIESKVFLEKK